MEKRIIQFADRQVEYYLARKKMKCMRMRIKEDGRLILSCPLYTPLYQINGFIEKNLDWITVKTKEMKDRPRPEAREYVTGEKFLFCGEECVLTVFEGKRDCVQKIGGSLLMTLKDKDDHDKKRKLIDSWYKKNTEKVFKERFEYCTTMYRHLFPDNYTLKIRRMKARWGSCMINQKTVVLNSQLIYADIKYLDYVILHELCHFHYKNHDKDFYGLLEKLSPDYKILRKNLTNFYINYSH